MLLLRNSHRRGSFFEYMSSLSPILDEYYSDYANHRELVTQEPLLCTTMLMISSRYHILPGVGGASRGYFIHQRLWDHCQQLLLRIMLGQEKMSRAINRSVGSIEAFLLMTEWHPRALHFPPLNEGWDSDLVPHYGFGGAHAVNTQDNSTSASRPTPDQWLENVIEPARRSDKMSWMLLGNALSLAHELGIFDDEKVSSIRTNEGTQPTNINSTERTAYRCGRVRKLLYVYTEQLTSRLGCTAMFPQNVNLFISGQASKWDKTKDGERWQSIMSAWIELTKLVKSVSDMLFPSPTFTTQILSSGRYIGLLEHFQPLLKSWHSRHLESNSK